MKIFYKFSFLIAIVILFIEPFAFAGTDISHVKLFAHRGLCTRLPENSIEAVNAAKKLGLSGTEIDLRTTKDKKIILLHDASLDRTTTGTGDITDLTFDEVQKFFLINKKGMTTSCKIPLFKDILAKVCLWKNFILALDVKNVDVEKTAHMVIDYAMEKQVYFFIPGPDFVDTAKKIKAIDSNLMISVDLLNWWQIMEVPQFVIKALDADAVFASEWFFPRHGFSEAKKANAEVQVFLWGNHDLEKRMKHAIELGADVISSDRPDLLLKYLTTLTR